jgi:hypothetical protein
MIFPAKLPYVTMYVPDTDQYYELPVFASRLNFALESFYQREAISGSKDYKPRGVRFDMSLSFDQTQNHDTLREFFNQLVTVQDSPVHMYFQKQEDIINSTDYLEVLNSDFAASLKYENQIRKHGYNLEFTGRFSDLGIGLFYILTNDGGFVLNNEGQRLVVTINAL